MESAEKKQLLVEGMTCSNCAMGVAKRLEKRGLTNVDVNFSTGEVRYTDNPEIKQEIVVSDIKSLGYRVVDESDHGKNSQFWTIERKFYVSLFFSVPVFESGQF